MRARRMNVARPSVRFRSIDPERLLRFAQIEFRRKFDPNIAADAIETTNGRSSGRASMGSPIFRDVGVSFGELVVA